MHVLILVYVDDLVIIGLSLEFITTFITQLHREFSLKDNGDLSYFLGLELKKIDSGMFLSKTKYI